MAFSEVATGEFALAFSLSENMYSALQSWTIASGHNLWVNSFCCYFSVWSLTPKVLHSVEMPKNAKPLIIVVIRNILTLGSDELFIFGPNSSLFWP